MNTPGTPRKRIPAADRRELIVNAAALTFAHHGFAATTSQMLARQAGVSETLIYRHFRSKVAIYRAVLRKLMRQQDVEFYANLAAAANAADAVRNLHAYLGNALDVRDGSDSALAMRLMIASLAGDGLYARLIYRRALRLRAARGIRPLSDHAAPGSGAWRLDPTNGFLLVSHVGLMLSINRAAGADRAPYAGDRERLLGDAVAFCAQGIGIAPAIVADFLAAGSAPAGCPSSGDAHRPGS